MKRNDRKNRSALRLLILIFIFSLMQNILNAQVCSGSLGDPVVQINFGAGNGIGAALPSATTSYNYVANDCPSDGNYTVINRTNACFNSTWYVYNEDHTPGDVNGYMMLVNSSLQPNDFFVDTVRGLCANTQYEFSAWITNVIIQNTCNNNPSSPNILFTVESVAGAILGTYSTGNILAKTGPVWEKYGLFFTTNASDPTVVIRMRNNAPGGCGNDLALDDISFRPCGPLVNGTVNGATQTNARFCEGFANTINLSATISAGYSNPTYQWQSSNNGGLVWNDIAGANSTTYNTVIFNAGSYLFRLAVAEAGNLANINCRIVSNHILIEVKRNPLATASVNSPVCVSTPVNLIVSPSTGYQWSGPNGFSSISQNPSFPATLNASGIYSVIITDEFSCKGYDTIVLQVNPSPTVGIIASDDTVCRGVSVTLNATGATDYSWQPSTFLNAANQASVIATADSTINYLLIGSNNFNCKDSASFQIKIVQPPTVNAGADQVIVTGASILLNGTTNEQSNNILWSPPSFLSNVNVLKPTASPLQDISYTITANSAAGCGAASDQVDIKLYNGIFIPNSFTPNGDLINDTWRVPALAAFTKASISIYNRYGQRIFESKNNTEGWRGTYNGQPANAGAYNYLIDLKDGSPVMKGTLLLIR